MKNYLYFFIFLITYFFSISVYAQIEKGIWKFVKDPDYCYIGSSPTEIDIPEGKKRGDAYILVYRINKSEDAVVQINAGYPYKAKNGVKVLIDNAMFDFWSEDDTAWSNDDNKVIYAMKRGLQLTVNGESSRGTKTSDTYTLKGFTAAYNKLFNDC